MRKIFFIILIAAIIALFVVPESTIGDYQGLMKLKYFLRDTAIKVKNIIFDLAKTGESGELKDIGGKAKETIQKGIKEQIAATTTNIIKDQIGVE